MNIASIYPNGIEKCRNKKTKSIVHSPEVKNKVLAMLERGIKIVMVCEKHNIDKATVFGWQEAKERY